MMSGEVSKQTRDEAAGRARLLWPGALSLAALSGHSFNDPMLRYRPSKRSFVHRAAFSEAEGRLADEAAAQG